MFPTTFSPSPSVVPPIDPHFRTTANKPTTPPSPHHSHRNHKRRSKRHRTSRSLRFSLQLDNSPIECDCQKGYEFSVTYKRHLTTPALAPKSLPAQFFITRWRTLLTQKLSCHKPVFRLLHPLDHSTIYIHCCNRKQRNFTFYMLRQFKLMMRTQSQEIWTSSSYPLGTNINKQQNLPSYIYKPCCIMADSVASLDAHVIPILHLVRSQVKLAQLQLFATSNNKCYFHLLTTSVSNLSQLIKCLLPHHLLQSNITIITDEDEIQHLHSTSIKSSHTYNSTAIIPNIPKLEIAQNLVSTLHSLPQLSPTTATASFDSATKSFRVKATFATPHYCKKFIQHWKYKWPHLTQQYNFPIYTHNPTHTTHSYYKLELQAISHLTTLLKQKLASCTPLPSPIQQLLTQVFTQLTTDLPPSLDSFVNKTIPQHAFSFLQPFLLSPTQSVYTTHSAQTKHHTGSSNISVLQWNTGAKLSTKTSKSGLLTHACTLLAPDIIALQEIRNSKALKPPENISLPGYSICAWCPAKHKGGPGTSSGGSAIYVKNSLLQHYRYTKILTSSPYHSILHFHSRNSHNQDFVFFNCYIRPYTATQGMDLQTLGHYLAKYRNKTCILVGDFNAFPLEIPRRSITTTKPNHNRDHKFSQFQQKYQLHCANPPQPTSFNQTGTHTVYDLSLSNQDIISHVTPVDLSKLDINSITKNIDDVTVHGQNYHKPVYTQLSLTYPSPNNTTQLTYDINYASATRCHLPSAYANIQPIVHTFLRSLTPLLPLLKNNRTQTRLVLDTVFYIYQYATLKTNLQVLGLKRKLYNITDPLYHWRNHPMVAQLLTQYESSIINQNPDQSDSLQQNIKHLISQLQSNNLKKQFHNFHTSKTTFWWKQYRKHKSHLRDTITNQPPTTMFLPNTSTLVPSIQASTQFTSNLYNQFPPKFHSNRPTSTLHHSFAPDQIRTIINNLKNATPGIFKIPASYYKTNIDYCSSTLAPMYSLFANHNYLPWLLKINLNIALPKYPSHAPLSVKQDPSNYRYIGLQNNICKIYDSYITNELTHWTEINSVLHPAQAGFQRHRGTLEQIMLLQHAFFSSKHLYLAFIDLRKAYDSICLKHLFDKLTQLHAPPSLIHKFQLLLTNTTCINKIDGQYSTTYTRTNGLPQGGTQAIMV